MGPMLVSHIAILVPAHNEERLLARCLASIQEVRRMLPACMVSDVVVVSDDSSDRRPAPARELVGDGGIIIEV